MNLLRVHREEATQSDKESRIELAANLKTFEERFTHNVKDFNELQRQKFQDLVDRQEQIRGDTGNKLEKIRETMESTLEKTRETIVIALEKTRETVELRLEKTRETVENKLGVLQEENSKKLEEMRATVDEKLQSSVEKRFNESFKLISERLDQVHKGLGEMQTLATGVGDLKKVLTNVKTRGNLGEIQLGAILEEIFSADQYEQNISVKVGSQERVEFAIKLPGRNADNQSLLLPIDSKFPVEDYQRLLDAYENLANLDGKAVENIGKQFENAVRRCAKDIRDKYIDPPGTTDFAILFVPTEGLYAEILRRPGLFDSVRRENRVTIVGPTNLVAFLNSLQMGFRTLAIEKRSSEVWAILGAVKSEFSQFGLVLAKTKKKLVEATNTIDAAGVRTRAIERHLRKVEELPKEEAVELIGKTLEMEAEDIKDEEIKGEGD
jgi:DNA recombination protein RmuC